MQVVSAFSIPDGIQVHTQIDDTTVEVRVVKPADPDWPDAVAAAVAFAQPD